MRSWLRAMAASARLERCALRRPSRRSRESVVACQRCEPATAANPTLATIKPHVLAVRHRHATRSLVQSSLSLCSSSGSTTTAAPQSWLMVWRVSWTVHDIKQPPCRVQTSGEEVADDPRCERRFTADGRRARRFTCAAGPPGRGHEVVADHEHEVDSRPHQRGEGGQEAASGGRHAGPASPRAGRGDAATWRGAPRPCPSPERSPAGARASRRGGAGSLPFGRSYPRTGGRGSGRGSLRTLPALPFRAPPRHGASDVEPLLHRRQGGPRDRRLARHRAHDRARLRRGRREGLHLVAQGRGVRPGCGRAVAAGHVRLAARGLLDRRRRARPGRGPPPARAGASHPGQQRGRQLGRAARRVPRLGVGQGARLEREGRLPPDARLPAAPRTRRAARRPGARHQHRLDRRPPRARPRDLCLLREQGGGAPPDARARAPVGGAERHRECDRARPLREQDDARDARALPRRDRRLLSARAHRRARGHGGRGDLPRLACRRVPDRRRHPGGRGHHDAARVMASTEEAAGTHAEPLGLAERAKRAFFRSFFRLLLGFIPLAGWASAAWVLFVAGVHVPRAAHLLAPLAIYALNRWIITRPRHVRSLVGTLIRVYVPVAFSSIFLALFLALAGALWSVGALVAGPHLARAYYWLVNAGFASVAGLLCYGYTFGRRQLAVSHLEVPVRGLPSALDGLRIVHLSDLHAGAHLGLSELCEHVERVNALAPDLICLTGDLVDRPETCAEAFPTLAGLRARHGVFVILGNHDVYAGAETVTAALRALTRFRVLRDERVDVAIGGAVLTLLGVDDLGRDWARGVLEHPALPPLAAGVPAGRPFIVLSHRPTASRRRRGSGPPSCSPATRTAASSRSPGPGAAPATSPSSSALSTAASTATAMRPCT